MAVGRIEAYETLSLRDQIAISAMQGIIAAGKYSHPEIVSVEAYAYAERMLKMRDKYEEAKF